MSGIGHNSLAKSKSLLIEDLIKQRDNMSKEGLEELKEKKREIKLRKFDFDVNVMGKELSELRYDPETGSRLSNEYYGKLVSAIFKTVAETTWFTSQYRASCQWAYENPEDLEKVKEDNPRCLSVLTLYMRKSKGEEEPDPESDEDDTDGDVVDTNKGGNDSKPGSVNSPSGQGGNTGSYKPSGGSSGDKDKPKKPKPVNNPDYCIAEGMGAIKGIAELYSREYGGTPEDAADVLFSQTVKGCEQDSIGMSIARDRVKWFLKLKEVMDLVEPKMHDFLNQESKLQVIK